MMCTARPWRRVRLRSRNLPTNPTATAAPECATPSATRGTSPPTSKTWTCKDELGRKARPIFPDRHGKLFILLYLRTDDGEDGAQNIETMGLTRKILQNKRLRHGRDLLVLRLQFDNILVLFSLRESWYGSVVQNIENK